MARVEPTLENALARAPHLREGALNAAREDWAKRPTRKGRAWARLLARAAANDASEFVRNAAIGVLGELGTASDRRILRTALNDDWEVTQASAVSALARVVGVRAEEEILQAIQDKSWIVRRFAWVALYDALGVRAMLHLVQAAGIEKDDEIAVGIWGALLQLEHPEARERVEAYSASNNPRLNGAAREWLEEVARKPGRGSAPDE